MTNKGEDYVLTFICLALAPRGHKPIPQEVKEQPSRRLVLCLSPLVKALPIFYFKYPFYSRIPLLYPVLHFHIPSLKMAYRMVRLF
jgi:hypothetical protein